MINFQWRSISELEKLNNLEDLKFRENPILKNESLETTRQLIIARISKLKYLNSTQIFYAERSGAENDYLKLFAKQWTESEKDPEKRLEFLNNHPRYPALVKSKLDFKQKKSVILISFFICRIRSC